jgi:hypothetical protein
MRDDDGDDRGDGDDVGWASNRVSDVYISEASGGVRLLLLESNKVLILRYLIGRYSNALNLRG